MREIQKETGRRRKTRKPPQSKAFVLKLLRLVVGVSQNQPDQLNITNRLEKKKLNITNQWELEYVGFQRYRILEDISKAPSMAANP